MTSDQAVAADPPFAVDVQNVTKRFGRQLVLDSVSLQVPAGMIFAILGENGAGKTTLIRILLGLTKPDNGSVRLLGSAEAFHSPALNEQIGYVPDRPELHDWMTVAETGWFASAFFSEGYLDRYRKAAADFQLPDNTKVRDLSKGMRAKVSWSLALAKAPKLLILDEPTSGLDSLVRREVLESLVDLAAEGCTVLLCSHQIHEVERVADYVGVLHENRFQIIERLEKLKLSFVERRVTLREHGGSAPAAPAGGIIVSQARRGRQWRQLIRFEKTEDVDAGWETDERVESDERLTPGLEEIFCGLIADTSDVAVRPSSRSTSDTQ